MYMIYTVAWYNMLVYSEYMSWYDTFGLHTGPLSVCLELALLERYSEKYSAWATAAESTGQRSCTLDFNNHHHHHHHNHIIISKTYLFQYKGPNYIMVPGIWGQDLHIHSHPPNTRPTIWKCMRTYSKWRYYYPTAPHPTPPSPPHPPPPPTPPPPPPSSMMLFLV